MITKKAHAKLNLSLDVTGKRENGYHDIKTLMVMTDLYDEMKFSKSDKLEILGDFDFDMKENFIYKAYLALRDYVDKYLPFKVEIEKNIPMAGGLAGGTSNGAGTFYALNDLYDLKIPKKDLIKLSSSLGADFTYMMTGGTKLASGIGEILEEVRPIELDNVLVVNPGYGVSTKEVYESIKIDEKRIDFDEVLQALYDLDIKRLNKVLENKMEDVVFEKHRDLLEIKNKMREFNSASLMSGSGATIFGIFENKNDLEDAYRHFKRTYDKTFKLKVGEKFGSF
ncbi:4-(cytidine 5'-diphospho)-2-C-methyl-D-erythritol kinase [Peptoniphilus harei]|uniref:4-(cytidine 5'-diphospho)-2-C-methyl-D-erythritol kinase n=1 Tax=Peptoniphilus harei TaxID=54005 RepID=UPI00255076B8|nr:4-(cytidine 5'-diphospho)-2-C-methyl-D-erythritol kinase [Peptoniphilus harei]MDK7355284.1 4-(cytidine 5'-diphospho)-2-C-methyl-D-erythritol kinase [Peptoniphilus harei]MDK7370913.1 4-(cytidine 5'-diphospho)-2-C-methyl-D-erythritol kinase [Peptoniphilus harei]